MELIKALEPIGIVIVLLAGVILIIGWRIGDKLADIKEELEFYRLTKREENKKHE